MHLFFDHSFDCKFPACVFFVKLIFVKLDILDYNITWDVYYVMYGWMIWSPRPLVSSSLWFGSFALVMFLLSPSRF